MMKCNPLVYLDYIGIFIYTLLQHCTSFVGCQPFPVLQNSPYMKRFVHS